VRPSRDEEGRHVGSDVVAGGFMFVFAVAYLVVYLFVFPSRLVPDDRPVPDVRGRLVDDADRALRDAGFVPRTGQRRVDASVVAGTVVSQSPPPAASRPRGSAVVLDVSAEP